MRATSLWHGLAVGLLSGFVGCAGSDSGTTVLASSGLEAIVLLPMNTTTPLPRDLEPEAPALWKLMARYLRAHGSTVKTLSESTARALWRASIREARESTRGRKEPGFEQAARILVAKIAEHAEFGAVIVPSLFVQRAEVADGTATWDGAVQAIEVETYAPDALPRDLSLQGFARAASLHVVVLDSVGNQIQERQSGLVVLVRVRVTEGASRVGYARHPSPFGDRGALWEGTARALAPFLSPLAVEVLEDER